ncbi:alpha/beta hydrolase [Prescottella agglutinans]|uniref:Alpha/beta hydrolase n=1 Tax=Prescottella agglutinans TaxID=1644129 RepID=A0A3S3AFP2_9NOCA|nr:alpha/beta hydrolase [Prescottella agglutinans]RVW07036.1 alpha/beta hydrolase [Prescottella agglutinans]
MTIWNELAGIDFAVKTVDAAGIPTRSLQAGSGDEAVVFLHGTSGHLEAFARNIAVHAEHYECHAIDMLGHGYTGKPDYPYEIPRYVEHLVNYLDAVGLEKVHLVGESLGGWVAAHLASEQPERVLSVQLLAAGGTVANPEIMERIRTSTARAVQSDDVELTRARLRLLMHDPVDATEELVEARHRIYHQPDFVANIHNLLSLQDMETRQRNLLRPDRLARIQAPTLVVWGHENPFGDVPEAKKMAEDIPGAQLQLYPECGHWPQHEQAALYNPLSLEFLAKASAQASSVA